MKKIIALLAVSAFLALSGCAYTEKERYMNFLADLDLISRFDLCIDAAQSGKSDPYTRGELEVIRQDLSSFSYPYDDALRANDYLDLTAETLLNCMDCYETGDIYNYDVYLTQAREYYAQANAQISAVKSGAENV